MVFVVILDNNDIRLQGLFNPKGNTIRKKGIIQRNTVSLLGIFFMSLINIIITPVIAAVMLILNTQ